MTNMAHPPIEVAVLICCHQSKKYVHDCLRSVLDSKDPGILTHVVVVDDASTDGTGELVKQDFPEVHCIRIETNCGFSGANNVGWQHVRQSYPNVRYIALLNIDTIVHCGYLRSLVDYLEEHGDVGAAQAKLMLHPERDRINSAGNRCHFLGFGTMTGYREQDHGQYDQPRSIDYASGAMVMIRREPLEQVGLFDPTFYMYLEDAELSWKLRQIGFDTCLVPASIVYHRYRPDAPLRYYYWLERNRWLLLIVYYRLPTLVLLAPALLLMELGQLFFAWRHGKLTEKLRSYWFFWKPANIVMLHQRRLAAQKRRLIGDRPFMTRFADEIRFEAIDHRLLRFIGNPLLRAYWALVRPFIFW